MKIKSNITRFIFSPYSSLLKVLNAAVIFFQYRFIHNSRIMGYPIKLTIDPASLCMLKCPLCPTGQGSPLRKRGLLDFENYKKIIDELSPWLFEVSLYNWGEPLLNKNLVKMIEYAHKKKIFTSVNSNLNVKIDNAFADSLIKSGLDNLIVSIDGITQKTYSKYRRGGDLSLALGNLRKIIGAKKKAKTDTPKICWQFLVMRHNENEIEEAKKLSKDIGVDSMFIGAIRCDMGAEIYIDDQKKVNSIKNWLPTKSKYSRYDYENKKRKTIKKNCHFLWATSVINWNGSVSPCCAIYNEGEDFGNAFEAGFRKIWNNPKYRLARKAISTKNPNLPIVCKNCLKTGFVE